MPAAAEAAAASPMGMPRPSAGCADRFGDDRGEARWLFKEDGLPPAMPTESEIRDWCLAYVRRTVDDPAIAVGPDISFAEMGLDSATSAYFIVELEEWLGAELEPELVFEYPTIGELARHVAGRSGEANDGLG
jgi:acyl carrier protein